MTSTEFRDEPFGIRAAGEGRTGVTGVFFALIAISLLTVFPLVWMVASAFKTGTDDLRESPLVLLADEPTGNLDERATRGVFHRGRRGILREAGRGNGHAA